MYDLQCAHYIPGLGKSNNYLSRTITIMLIYKIIKNCYYGVSIIFRINRSPNYYYDSPLFGCRLMYAFVSIFLFHGIISGKLVYLDVNFVMFSEFLYML